MNTPLLRSLAPRFWLGAISSLLCAVAPVSLLAQSDDFNDGDDVGWTRYSPLTPFGVPGVFTFPNGAYRIQTTVPSPSPSSLGPGRAGSLRPENYTNFFVSVDIVDWNDSLPQASGILARVGNVGLGMTTGYAFTWSRGTTATGGDMDISRITNERTSGVSVLGNDKYHFVPGKKYRLVFIGKGPNLEGRVYELPNVATPVITMTGSDSTYATGLNGLVVDDNSSAANNLSDTTFDNFYASDIEPPKLTYEYNPSFNEFSIFWSAEYAPPAWTLQGTPSLRPPVMWTDLPGELVVDKYYYVESSESGNKFFRVKRR